MAAVDALTLRDDHGPRDYTRWAAGGAVALALHAGALVYLIRAPAPAGFESQVPIELDMMPPPSGEAKMSEPGSVDAAQADATQQVQPDEAEQPPREAEMLDELDPDQTPPPPDGEVVAAEEPTPQDETPPEEAVAVAEPLDSVETPPDVEAAVTLPPQDAVVAREEIPQPAPPVAKRVEPKPEPKPVVRRPEAKPAPKRQEQPKPDTRTAERTRPASNAGQAGGAGGVSANAGAAASSAAASSYRKRVQAAVASQKRTSLNLSGRVTVSFSVSRSGAVSNVSASGPGPVAAEAAAMVRRASIPPMPSEMSGGSARYTLPINFTPGR